MLVFWRAIIKVQFGVPGVRKIASHPGMGEHLNSMYIIIISQKMYIPKQFYILYLNHISPYINPNGAPYLGIFFWRQPPQKRRLHRWDPGMYICPTSRSGPFRQPNKNPSIPRTQRSTSSFRGWPEPFYGEQTWSKKWGRIWVQGINTRLEMSRKTSGKWKVPIVKTFAVLFVHAALFRWFWPLKKQRLLKGEIRTTTLFTGDGCLKNKKQTYRFRLFLNSPCILGW